MKSDQGIYYWAFSVGMPLVAILIFAAVAHIVVRRRTGSGVTAK
jgi:hypothetical protein